MNRRDFLKSTGLVAGASLLPILKHLPANAAAPGGTLVVISGQTINSLDIHRSGTNRASYVVAVNAYDRLVGFGTKTMPDGSLSYDYERIVPELAESWELAEDGMSMTFKLKPEATFWDGKPVRAQDVKWSFDRAVSVGGFPTVQMEAGSLEKPEQFEAVDDRTFKIHFLRKSKLTLPDLAVPVPIVINSEEAKKHATADDPLALEYLHRTPLGSGAFKIERWDAGQQIVFSRNDDWKGGALPAVERVIVRELPSQSTRRALIERGDAHVSPDLAAKDAKEMSAKPNVKVVGTPVENCIYVVGLNFQFEPFKDKNVRHAVAHAIPYEEIFKNAGYERGVPLWGGGPEVTDTAWPQPFRYSTDYDKAKELMAMSGHKDGFEVPLSISLDLAEWMEPAGLLIQEGLARINIKAPIEKIPGANWRTACLVEKRLPLHLENFGGWLNYPCYYFFWAYVNGHLFNSSNYENAEIERLVEETLHMPVEDPEYAPKIRRMIEIAQEDVPRIPLWQPYLDTAMRENVEGYEYWFHRQLDVRPLKLT